MEYSGTIEKEDEGTHKIMAITTANKEDETYSNANVAHNETETKNAHSATNENDQDTI
jgi:hypothetical protein